MRTTRQAETILVIILGLVLIYYFKRNDLLLGLALLIGIAGLWVPGAAAGIDWFWNKLGHVLGAVTGRILLAFVYFLVLLPLSLVARLLGKTSVRLRPGGETYFVERNHTYTKEDLQNPW